MSYRILITEQAESDLRAAKEWYEQRSIGLGTRFIAEISHVIESLLDPTVEHKAVFDNYRRVISKNFPYCIYYIKKEDSLEILIMAVLHVKQDQSKAISRLSK